LDTGKYLSEFIGMKLEVSSHSNSLYTRMSGTILDETARTFVLGINGSTKIVPKATGKFILSSKKHSFSINGNSIIMRPEERLKNLRKIIKQETRGDNYN
jgi:ribonuclease P protein subunit POP4